MKRYALEITVHAQDDLGDIGEYIESRDGEEQAHAVLDSLLEAVSSLQSLPERGNHPPEMKRLGLTGVRELHVMSYRVLYQIAAGTVYVVAFLSARRDVQAQLSERLLR